MTKERTTASTPPNRAEGDQDSSAVPIYVLAADPVSRAGVIAELVQEGLSRIVSDAELSPDVIVVVAADQLAGAVVRDIARLRRLSRRGLILIADAVDDALLVRATELGFSGIVRRRDATGRILAAAVRAVAAGDGSLPPDLIGRVLGVMERLHARVLAPQGLTAHGLTEREITVLRLVADGFDTAQIATELSYSERTIKDILHQVNQRLQLRNRAQAVAFAMRAGLI
jgi:DNA-binding NarL/FixJ family response regulator